MQRRLSRNVAAHQPKPRHLNNTSIATLAVYSLYTQHLRVFHGYVHIQYMCVYAWMRTGNGLKCFLRAVKKLKNSRNITTKQQHKKKEKKMILLLTKAWSHMCWAIHVNERRCTTPMYALPHGNRVDNALQCHANSNTAATNPQFKFFSAELLKRKKQLSRWLIKWHGM